MTKMTVGERLMRLETELDYVKNKTDSIDRKLTDFIKCADNAYARKIEVDALRREMENRRESRWEWRKFVPQIISVLIAGIALLISLS